MLAALENGVSQYPKLEGRFPQVAGIQFAFNPNSPPGERIYKDVVKIGDEYVDEEATYRLVTKAYMRHGKDGYDMLVGCPVLVSDLDSCYFISLIFSPPPDTISKIINLFLLLFSFMLKYVSDFLF